MTKQPPSFFSNLPPVKPGGHLRFIRAVKSLAKPKPAFAAPHVKKLVKIMEATGKHVSAVSVTPSGEIRVEVASADAPVSANPWDADL